MGFEPTRVAPPGSNFYSKSIGSKVFLNYGRVSNGKRQRRSLQHEGFSRNHVPWRHNQLGHLTCDFGALFVAVTIYTLNVCSSKAARRLEDLRLRLHYQDPRSEDPARTPSMIWASLAWTSPLPTREVTRLPLRSSASVRQRQLHNPAWQNHMAASIHVA